MPDSEVLPLPLRVRMVKVRLPERHWLAEGTRADGTGVRSDGSAHDSKRSAIAPGRVRAGGSGS